MGVGNDLIPNNRYGYFVFIAFFVIFAKILIYEYF